MITGHNHTSPDWTEEDQKASEPELHCPQCGEECEELVEGYCQECANDNYNEIFAHNYQQERWARMNEQERQDEIDSAMR